MPSDFFLFELFSSYNHTYSRKRLQLFQVGSSSDSSLIIRLWDLMNCGVCLLINHASYLQGLFPQISWVRVHLASKRMTAEHHTSKSTKTPRIIYTALPSASLLLYESRGRSVHIRQLQRDVRLRLPHPSPSSSLSGSGIVTAATASSSSILFCFAITSLCFFFLLIATEFSSLFP
ncbi:hypothetical protein J5N97_025038 [Dioscorea zingiberensis]|uniref:Uncharacterized protein n=1 Tax=Dioscorea zingiberensis TaxID=325984 RepID=A0A9D5C7S2_9LILI|nr:hypothetical protein J5N97_025038 [Dioscorea zingiberensis]